MARDLPCSVCGTLLYRNPRTSLPEGRATCRPCRRVAHGLRPDQLVNDAKRAGLIGTVGTRLLGDCHRCGAAVPPGSRRWKFCGDECFRKNRNARGSGKPSSAARGYDYEHVKLRAQLLPLAHGTDCHFCGEVMREGDNLHLDHTEDRASYRGIVHAACNVLDGARRGGERARLARLERGWRPGQDPSTRRRPTPQAA